jgi:Cft2 family RNA processing exonuclease
MQIHCISGIGEVGASCLVVESAGRRVLVDAGIRMGSPDPLPDLAQLQEGGGIDAVVVTHAHADHIGALPLAVGPFPAAPVLATPATLAIMSVMLEDAVRIGELRAEQDGDLPAYGRPQVNALLERARPLGFRQPYPLLPPAEGRARGWQLTFFPAGHVLGAAMALLETPEGTVLVSGDVSVAPQHTVSPAGPPRRRVDMLVLESTYGNRLHASRAGEETRLLATIQEVIGRGGHCLIPAFALGRAQEVLLILAAARSKGLLDAPVWVDGLVRAVCGVYATQGAAGSPRLRKAIERQGNPFITTDGAVRALGKPTERQALLAGPPAVIVASSGMLQGGPSAYYAAQLAPDPKHAILITGYQDEEAPGRALLDLAAAPADQPRKLTLGGVEVAIRCQVGRYSLSAHADGDELAALAHTLQPGLTVLVHGDDEARAALSTKLTALSLRHTLPANGAIVQGPRRRSRGGMVVMRADSTEAELLTLTRGSSARRGWTAYELADRHYGMVTTEGVAAVTAVLEASEAFSPDLTRPGAFRLHAGKPSEGPADQELVGRRLRGLFHDVKTHRKSGLYPAEKRADLHFHFPDVAAKEYAEVLAELAKQTGWTFSIRPSVDQGALVAAALRHLPEGLAARGTPSLHLDQRRVEVAVTGTAPDEATAAAQEAFRAETAYELTFAGVPATPTTSPTPSPAGPVVRTGDRLEINAAFGAIRAELAARDIHVCGVGLQGGSRILVTFLTPALGRRYQALLDELAAQLGWPIAFAKHAQQQALIAVVQSIVTGPLAKLPGVHAGTEQVTVRLALGQQASGEEVAAWQAAVLEQTGYSLVV